MKAVKVAIANVSYKGPHKDCFGFQYEFMHYLGRLQERSALPPEIRQDLPSFGDPEADLGPEDPPFKFFHAVETGNSLIGQARDNVVRMALAAECDYVFFFDDDMLFDCSAFLRLWRNRKPFCAALAFTSREPICPVIYKFKRSWEMQTSTLVVDISPEFDYPRDALFRADAVGTGVVLIETSVFRKLSAPWFHGAIGSGEDIHFCSAMADAAIGVWVDSRIKTRHAPNAVPRWCDEEAYLDSSDAARQYWLKQRREKSA